MILSGSFSSRQIGKASTPPDTCKGSPCPHDRQAGLGADIAETEDAGPVADDGHGIPLVGVLVGLLLVDVDLLADRATPGVYQIAKSLKSRIRHFRAVPILPL